MNKEHREAFVGGYSVAHMKMSAEEVDLVRQFAELFQQGGTNNLLQASSVATKYINLRFNIGIRVADTVQYLAGVVACQTKIINKMLRTGAAIGLLRPPDLCLDNTPWSILLEFAGSVRRQKNRIGFASKNREEQIRQLLVTAVQQGLEVKEVRTRMKMFYASQSRVEESHLEPVKRSSSHPLYNKDFQSGHPKDVAEMLVEIVKRCERPEEVKSHLMEQLGSMVLPKRVKLPELTR